MEKVFCPSGPVEEQNDLNNRAFLQPHTAQVVWYNNKRFKMG